MKFIHVLILSIALFLLCSCTYFYAGRSANDPEVQDPKPLALPIGKNWQIIEEAPVLSNESGRLPFQMEQSVQPKGARPLTPEEMNRTIETSH